MRSGRETPVVFPCTIEQGCPLAGWKTKFVRRKFVRHPAFALGLPESCFLLSQLFLRLLELLLRLLELLLRLIELLLRLIELLPSLIQPLPSLIRQAHVMISALEHVFIDFAPLHERRAADVFKGTFHHAMHAARKMGVQLGIWKHVHAAIRSVRTEHFEAIYHVGDSSYSWEGTKFCALAYGTTFTLMHP